MIDLSRVDNWTSVNLRRMDYFRREPKAIVIIPNLSTEPEASAQAVVHVESGDHFLITRIESPFARGSGVKAQILVAEDDKTIASQNFDLPAGSSLEATVPFRATTNTVRICLSAAVLEGGATPYTWVAFVMPTISIPGQDVSFSGTGRYHPGIDRASDVVQESDIACRICGGRLFGPAASGRRARTGALPCCRTCQSYERHRVISLVYASFPADFLASKRVLQFSKDNSLPSSLFKSYECSIFGISNSMDMLNIPREDGAYDLVVSNHVLEHVHDDKLAMEEMLRVVGPTGLVHVTVPDTVYIPLTEDWGYADILRNEHYRHYGADFPHIITTKLPGLGCLTVVAQDAVTEVFDTVYFFSRSANTLNEISGYVMSANLVGVRTGDSSPTKM